MFKHLPEAQAKNLTATIEETPSMFKDTPGLVSGVQHDIFLKPNAKPKKAENVKKEDQYMLDSDLIKPSCSPWSSPVVLVDKEEEKHRLCFDYCKVSNCTVPDHFSLLLIEDCLDKIGKAKYVNNFDLLKGYWQVPFVDSAHKISALITPDGY